MLNVFRRSAKSPVPATTRTTRAEALLPRGLDAHDARLTGATRSLGARLLALNLRSVDAAKSASPATAIASAPALRQKLELASSLSVDAAFKAA